MATTTIFLTNRDAVCVAVLGCEPGRCVSIRLGEVTVYGPGYEVPHAAWVRALATQLVMAADAIEQQVLASAPAADAEAVLS